MLAVTSQTPEEKAKEKEKEETSRQISRGESDNPTRNNLDITYQNKTLLIIPR